MFNTNRLATFNARSLNKRYIEINNFLNEFKIDILAIQETWLNKNMLREFKGYKNIHTSPKTRKGCGVCILIREDIVFKVLEIYQDTEDIEYILLKI